MTMTALQVPTDASSATAAIVGGAEGGGVTGGFGRSVRAPLVSLFVGKRLVMFANKERGSDLERLASFFEDGSVVPRIGCSHPLAQVPDAMRHLIAGQARGKIAITV